MAPTDRTRCARAESDVTTQTSLGSAAAANSRTISSSAEFGRGTGACRTSITVDVIGGSGGRSNTTVTLS